MGASDAAGWEMADALVLGPLSGGSARLVRRFSAPERHLAFWIALWAAVVLGELGALAQFVLERSAPVEPVQVVFRLVGGSFAACGLIAWHRRPDSHSGRLLTATGFALFVSPLLSLIESPLALTAAHVLPDLWVFSFVALVLTFLTGGRLRTRVDRVLVGAVLLELLILAPLYTVFSSAEGTIQILPHEGISGIIDIAQKTLFLVVCTATAAVVVARWRKASPPGRRAMLAGVAGAGCLLAFAALLAVDLAGGGRVPLLVWIAACMLVTVPVAFLVGLLRSRLARGGVADLFRGLRTMRPDELRTALAKALGDPALVVAYPRPDGSFVDAEGRPVTLPAAGGDRSVTIVERDAEPVAALVYDRSLDDDPELVDAVGGAATIALENQHLHAEAQARLAELQASRERIITAADAERRRIERNLHDGAQQRLVTLALQLSLIQREIRRDPAEAEQLVTLATGELTQSMEELRELARGIHPRTRPRPRPRPRHAGPPLGGPDDVAYKPGPRLPAPVEFAAYFVASEALANIAKYAQASAATVRVSRTESDVLIEISDDGVGGADPAAGTGLRGLADRVESLGGRFQVSGRPGAGRSSPRGCPSPHRHRPPTPARAETSGRHRLGLPDGPVGPDQPDAQHGDRQTERHTVGRHPRVEGEHSADREGYGEHPREDTRPERGYAEEDPPHRDQRVAEQSADLQDRRRPDDERPGRHLRDPGRGEPVEPHVPALRHRPDDGRAEREHAEPARLAVLALVQGDERDHQPAEREEERGVERADQRVEQGRDPVVGERDGQAGEVGDGEQAARHHRDGPGVPGERRVPCSCKCHRSSVATAGAGHHGPSTGPRAGLPLYRGLSCSGRRVPGPAWCRSRRGRRRPGPGPAG